ncbi:hypothetical protein CPC735_066430 [Coccidioides posadasii C735 delta SOWgp]|uniref:Vacuolar protein sorting protein Vps66 n=1 Tax=Coccidioides posadasii (strain C735) TaxID=222929 RepID=C5PC66_COCP7|nr:hypothetical protein CPC735_066430 [Coccidioides posadasii C735 delta SOWgp]EER25543.1 hypothetical protein CPC735_066430 [Coccidioides posadasii C735 delta SOWgp]|eukprot:XP_003067688.1 hypothetical protein CPC735_066430 [Coccidioides posadasii C735 delta SOWgp]
MEKYSQFRDRASGIAPFLPVVGQVQPLTFALKLVLFCIRLPLFAFALFVYFGVLQWLPIGSLGNKACLWAIAGVAGLWWADLHIDGVKKGSLARQHANRLPQPGSVIASSFTSPVDSLYLAAVFDPIFTVSYPSTQKLRRVSLFQAILHAFSIPETHPSSSDLTELPSLLKQYPHHCIVVYPECTPTNGKGILELSPSITSAPAGAKVFPVNLRYTPGDITTPIPKSYFGFLWNLLNHATHSIRVRIGEPVIVGQNDPNNFIFDEQQTLLTQVGDALARLGRVKRVGLGVREKQQFIKMWSKNKKGLLS